MYEIESVMFMNELCGFCCRFTNSASNWRRIYKAVHTRIKQSINFGSQNIKNNNSDEEQVIILFFCGCLEFDA